MLNVTGFNKSFIPSWKMTLMACLAIVLLSRLGFWQLQRANEKKQMLQAYHRQAAAVPVVWNPAASLPKQYQPIKVQGNYLSTQFLLDNQHMSHQFGYHVLTPLRMSNNAVVLVDRGWIKGDVTRQDFPMVQTPIASRVVTGTVYFPSNKNWVLGDVLEKITDRLAVIESLDTEKMSNFLHKSVYPFIIRLAQEDSTGFIRDWPITAMPAERHVAYAIQWFAMAAVVMVLYVVLNLKKKDEPS